MAWVGVHTDVIGPKLRRLSAEAKISQSEALGILVALWLWGLNNADRDGEILNASRRDVGAAITRGGLSGSTSPEQVVASLINTGWIDEANGCLYIHDWDEWQEPWYKYLDRKASDTKRKREKRKVDRANNPSDCPADSP